MSKKQSSLSSQVQKSEPKKELAKPDAMKTEVEEIKRDFSSPSAYDQENTLAKNLYRLRQDKELPAEQKNDKLNTAMTDLGMLYGLENGVWTMSIDYAKYQPTLALMRRKIVAEYNCKTSLELMLADSIVASYWRIMKNERKMNLLAQKKDDTFSFDQLKVNVLKELNKEVDLANRRLNMNIILLKEIKQPALKVNIKTNNAFVGENQQFNNNQVQKDENNEAK